MTEREQTGRNARRVRAHLTCVAVAFDLYVQGRKLGCHYLVPVFILKTGVKHANLGVGSYVRWPPA